MGKKSKNAGSKKTAAGTPKPEGSGSIKKTPRHIDQLASAYARSASGMRSSRRGSAGAPVSSAVCGCVWLSAAG